jgi:hypothetical protein
MVRTDRQLSPQARAVRLRGVGVATDGGRVAIGFVDWTLIRVRLDRGDVHLTLANAEILTGDIADAAAASGATDCGSTGELLSVSGTGRRH